MNNNGEKSVEQRLKELGFPPAYLGFGMVLQIARLKIRVTDGPFGLLFSFSSFGARSAASYDVFCPNHLPKEEIADFIYVNVRTNFGDQLSAACRAYFESLSIPLFQ